MRKSFLIVFFLLILSGAYAQQDSTTNPQGINNAETDTLDTNVGTLPVFTTTSSDISGNNLQSQDISALLGASRDVFMQSVSMHFIIARFRYRGYNMDNMTVMLNGVRLNSLETGVAGWSTWGGMNDVIRFMDMKTGLGASRSTFGDVGGYFNLNVYASSFRKGLRVTYSQGNRIFKERATLTYSTGMLKNGWAFSFSGTARYAAKGYVPGTSFQGFGYYLGVDKKLNDKHTLSFVGFGAPITQGRQSMETDEAYTLANDKHYNSFWGYQNGQIRNSRISSTNVPTAILSDVWNINEKSKLTTSAYYSFGRTSLTGLNYFDDVNPAPDYYQYMPSYYNNLSTNANPHWENLYNQIWQNGGTNPLTGFTGHQVDWDALYNDNYNNLYLIQNENGSGSPVRGKRSKYIIEEKRQDVKTAGFNSIYNTRISDVFITAGLNVARSKTRFYKVMNDLLGGDFWLDIDQFANQLSPDPKTIQNNVNAPDKAIRKGDVFGYDYNVNVTRSELWGQAEKSFGRFDLYLSATVSNTSFYRDGHMVNGKFLETSGGKSSTLNFLNYGVKSGITYKIDGHNYLTLNAAYITKPPLPSNSFISPQTRNDVVTNVGSEKITSGDITYQVRFPWLKGRITYFHSIITNQVWERSYFDDVFKTNVNYFMTNLNQLNQGIECGLEGNIKKRIAIIGALAYGNYIYTNRPTATISADNSAQLLATDRQIYFKNYYIGGSPQQASSIGVRYTGRKPWYIGLYYNYFANNYVTPNPDRRTQEALSGYFTSDPQVNKILTQEKLPNAYTIDMMAGKSFRFKNKYGLNLMLMVNNLTNNIFKNSGEEQLRHDVSNIDKFPNKYSYSLGLTYMMSVAFTFN